MSVIFVIFVIFVMRGHFPNHLTFTLEISKFYQSTRSPQSVLRRRIDVDQDTISMVVFVY
jgi:hypothetical protein